MSEPLADGVQRAEALDPSRSFIVQAPAGSGKTGLLTLRFLKLLARVNQPEEVVAITFTRKAAAEMKSRILEALEGGSQPAPKEPYLLQTWELAKEAVEHDALHQWGLKENPGRLRVLTIDSLCSTLARQMPVLSRLGGPPAIETDAWPFYGRAARETLDHLAQDNEISQAVCTLLDHLDNNRQRTEDLLADMLARRDQWLPHLQMETAKIRPRLEESLQSIIAEQICKLTQSLPPAMLQGLLKLAQTAARHLAGSAETDSPILTWDGRDQLPEDDLEAVEPWLGLAELLLTSPGDWRKSFSQKQGFPPQTSGRTAQEKADLKKFKAAAKDLVESLAPFETFRINLLNIRLLPPLRYSDGQWEILSALLTLLPVAAAHLKLVFSEQKKVDFAEVSHSAILALGETDQPTNLGLKLDYQISHLLIDEFQDTSRSQSLLLSRLIAGWEGGSGKTLFLVGDPMQSIYRFREAEVGVFLNARRFGIAPIILTPLTLRVNFRSEAGIVNWVNHAMADIFPQTEEISVGAVPYSESDAFHPRGLTEAVRVHSMPINDPLAEAGEVASLTVAARQKGLSVAVLVRSRNHLKHILPAFEQVGLRYQAVELNPLQDQAKIQDLLALTRALSHPADRIAWLSILRAPWCGLSLADLNQLVDPNPPVDVPPESSTLSDVHSPAHEKSIWQLMQDSLRVSRLSADGQARLLRVRAVLSQTLERRGRGSHFPGQGEWRRWVEGCWQALGGPATLKREADLLDVRTFFDLLEASEGRTAMPDLDQINRQLGGLYGATDPHADADLTVMTLHKAKGLEFDVVILPGLHRRPRGESRKLLTWLDNDPNSNGDRPPLLAPIARSDQNSEDAIQKFIRSVDKQKTAFETARLLYVAVTRAKKNLHLLAETVEEGNSPAPNSFLGTLWPVLSQPFTGLVDKEESKTGGRAGGGELIAPPLQALNSDWVCPKLPEISTTTLNAMTTEEPPVLFDWAGETVRLVGSVVHRYLSRIADEGAANWSAERVEAQSRSIRAHLINSGIHGHGLSAAVDRVKLSLIRSLADERGRWILDGTHQDSRSEFALSGHVDGRLIRGVIDRCFIDSDGIRWIIDFKSSYHAGGDLPGFLNSELIRYQDQLHRYGTLFRMLEDRPIRLGLYFPLMSEWRAWSFGE
ncbi:MAG: UvrD-helicase domain-containing protein [Magnetococcales bacterium]|nr:UvrD-helicase domain-containing protein [Magnetococcales bacterium]